MREISTNRVYQFHHDRSSNSILTLSFSRGSAPDPGESDSDPEPKDANPIENEREAGDDLEPASNPDSSLISTRSSRASRPFCIPDYEYQLPLFEVSLASVHAPLCANASRAPR